MVIALHKAKAELFRTLGHPVRVRALELLLEGPRPVHEMLEIIGIESSSLSHQLAVLRQHGLVHQRRDAGSVIYSLALPAVRDLLAAAREVLHSRTVDQGVLVDEVSRPADAS
mgnify:CR=1 FL=1